MHAKSKVLKTPTRFNRMTRAGVVATVAALGTLIVPLAGISNASVQSKQPTLNVTVAVSSSIISMDPFWVGQQTGGIFSQRNINLKIVTLSASTVNPALVAGSVQFVMQTAIPFFQARQSSIPIETVLPISEGVSLGLIVSNSFAAKKGISVKTPIATVVQDLAGSTEGAASNSTIGQAQVLLSSYGVTKADYHVANFTTLSGIIAAFDTGSVDWFTSAEPNPLVVQAGGFGIQVATNANAPAWHTRQLNELLDVDTAYAQSHPAYMKRVIPAIAAAVKYVGEHEQKSVTPAQQNLPGVSRPILLKSIAGLTWPITGLMNANIWRSTIAFNVKSGLFPIRPTAKEGVDWTNQYV